MKPRGELLGRLQQLSSRDRSWIMQQLSESERERLLATLDAPEMSLQAVPAKSHEVAPPLAVAETKKADCLKALSKVDPRVVAALLRHEPAWLGAIVVATSDEVWSKAVLEALPASLRSEIERIRSQPLGDELAQAVARQLLARCEGEVKPASESAFDRLVERIGVARSKRRLTLHL